MGYLIYLAPKGEEGWTKLKNRVNNGKRVWRRYWFTYCPLIPFVVFKVRRVNENQP